MNNYPDGWPDEDMQEWAKGVPLAAIPEHLKKWKDSDVIFWKDEHKNYSYLKPKYQPGFLDALNIASKGYLSHQAFSIPVHFDGFKPAVGSSQLVGHLYAWYGIPDEITEDSITYHLEIFYVNFSVSLEEIELMADKPTMIFDLLKTRFQGAMHKFVVLAEQQLPKGFIWLDKPKGGSKVKIWKSS